MDFERKGASWINSGVWFNLVLNITGWDGTGIVFKTAIGL